MRNFKRVLALVAVLVLLVGVMAGCNGSNQPASSSNNTSTNDDSDNSSNSSQKVRIGLSLATLQEERWQRDRDAFKKKAESLGAEILIQSANGDENLQNNQVENLLSQDLDLLVIIPQNADSAAALVEDAHKAGVKVISYDRMIMNTDVDLYISFDNEKVGELQGKFLTDLVPKGVYYIFSGSPTDNNAKYFKAGAMKYIQPLADKGDIKIAYDQAIEGWKPDQAMKLMENALTANNNKVDAVLAPNDGTAGGIIQALAAQGLAGKVPVTGQDADLAAVKRIIEGTQSMTVFKDARKEAEKAAELAVQMAQGKEVSELTDVNSKVNNGKIDVPSVLLTPVTITKDNIDKELIESGWFTKEQVYGSN
ncbi:D-xylose ABC transporter substrate-binding protein [Mahella australiensis]|uniref:Xylose-binding protein n=1 Tax=Mahella australiensis (strain DSM 15567 / CIP 107919 / 50-1 BON) TaxID=697281 RepID=F3ZWC1_MAHA5|nr:D-xylose ABC transporter substrate-binding protein [Mahella australiensis]AEE97530.1 xylose-binding protein [Mahella australiensis 50-1 BON]